MWRRASSEFQTLVQWQSALKPSRFIAGDITLRDQPSSSISSLFQRIAPLFAYQASSISENILKKRIEGVVPIPTGHERKELKKRYDCHAMMPEGLMRGMPQHFQSIRKFQQSCGSDKVLDYWMLPKNAILKDVATVIRADEANRRDVNHFSSGTESSKSDPSLATNMKLSRPLSPHLPMYLPQRSSMISIFNRIAAAFLAGEICFVYLCLKMGAVNLTYFQFYDFLFNLSKLTLISAELAGLALFYHVLATFLH